ncbi:MAG TPA: GAF domain-containing protein [Pirellulaceae bacterium]|nr:GAF domain-containing protein [Pirellulaceae bacterium]
MNIALSQAGVAGAEKRSAPPGKQIIAGSDGVQDDGLDLARRSPEPNDRRFQQIRDPDRERTGETRQDEQMDARRVLDFAPVGLLGLDEDAKVLWANEQAQRWIGALQSCRGVRLLDLLNEPAYVGSCFSPFESALATSRTTSATLRTGDNRWFSLQVTPTPLPPAFGEESAPERLIAVMQDVSAEALERQKLEALFRASASLLDLLPQEVTTLTHEERVGLLRENIQHTTQDILNYNVIEVRLLDPNDQRLIPLLSIGLDDTARNRDLYASPERNGVTGYVAATGVSYLCDDTCEDRRYLQGFEGARSSLTVPLKIQEQVIGTFNVESPHRNAFTHRDLSFVEIFSRSIAAALNTLDLLNAQKSNTAQESFEAIHRAVALPIDDILSTIGLLTQRVRESGAAASAQELGERIQPFIKTLNGKAREVRRIIHETGEMMAPVPAALDEPAASVLRGHRVLVVDEEADVRNESHEMLKSYGVDVDTSVCGETAICMIKSAGPSETYDAILCAVHLSDMESFEFYARLRALYDDPPMIMMKGWGYDPHHNLQEAVKLGMSQSSLVSKPLQEPQVVQVLERVLSKESTPV